MNRLSTLLPLANILVEAEARDKSAALDCTAALFAASTDIACERIRASLDAREAMGSTGLGQGVAIPHGRIRGLRQACAAVIRLARPLEFGAPDSQPVSLLFALLVPENASQEHLELLSELAQMLSDRALREALHTQPDAASVLARITAWAPAGRAA